MTSKFLELIKSATARPTVADTVLEPTRTAINEQIEHLFGHNQTVDLNLAPGILGQAAETFFKKSGMSYDSNLVYDSQRHIK